MHRSPVVPALLLFVIACASTAMGFQNQSPPGAQPPNSPTQVQNPVPGQNLPEQTPSDQRPPLATPAPPGATTPPPMPSPGSSTSPPAPKSPVEPSAAGGGSTAPPPQPKTEILDTSDTSSGLETDGHDPFLDPPPMPMGSATLVGGVISNVDRVRNHLDVAVFGGGHWTIYFDERTHIFRNGIQTTQMSLKKGDRIYVDTMLDNNKHDIFARNIRVGMVTAPADASGQIVEVHSKDREIVFRDALVGQTVHFVVAPNALINKGSRPASFDDLHAGSLVAVKFAPERADRGLAREISILATPGSKFAFFGVVTFLDTHRGILAVRTPGDSKTYDLRFVPRELDPEGRLAVGAEVQAVAIFDGRQYTAQQLKVTRMAGATGK